MKEPVKRGADRIKPVPQVIVEVAALDGGARASTVQASHAVSLHHGARGP